MDRGYTNFQIESTQVTIAPEKDDMYITLNVNEGDVFHVSEIKLAGTMVVPEGELRKLLLIKPRVALRLVMKVGFSSHAVQQVCL